MNKNYLILLLLISALFNTTDAQNVNTSNVRFKKINDQYIINYDLDGERKAFYNVNIRIINSDKKEIVAEAVYGDVNKGIRKGKNKEIKWTYPNDVAEIEILDLFVIAKKEGEEQKSGSVGNVFVSSVNGLVGGIGTGFKYIGIGLYKIFAEIDVAGLRVEGGFGGVGFKQTEPGTNRVVWTGSLGVMARYNLSERINFQWEVLYANRGHDVDSTNTVFNRGGEAYNVFRKKLNISYLQFPVMFNFEAGESFDISAGGYFGTALNGVYEITDLSLNKQEYDIFSTDDFPTSNMIAQPFEKWDAGFLLGGNFNKEYFDLGVRLYRSLTDINNTNYWIEDNPTKSKEIEHWALNFYATLRIPFNK